MRAAFEGVDAHDSERVTQFGDEQTYLDFVVLGPVVGRTSIRAFFDELFRAFPDLRFEIERILDVDDDTAVGQWRASGTFTGGVFQEIEPTGRRLDIRGIDVMEFEDGVLRRNTVYYDGLAFARQIGLLPTEGSAADRAMLAAFNGLTKAKAAVRSRRG